jgi:hypothetical protein
VIEFLRTLPILIRFLLELKKLWDEGVHDAEKREMLSRLSEATKVARESKDTSHLEAIFRDVVSKL